MAALTSFSPVVSFPQSLPTEPITQLELKLLLSLRNRLAQLQAQVASEEATLRSRVESGAAIEPGIHSVKLEETFRRNVSWKSVAIRLAKRLKLDGKAYCGRVLAGTRPSRSVSLVIS
jgi:hypothetical protein